MLFQDVRVRLPFATRETETLDSTRKIMLICERFHKIARQLVKRHDKRPPLRMTDEYDVQDLLHALLRMFFEDIRPEECTPSYAGGSARVDFLIKRAQTVVEVKHDLEDKQVGDQLLIDIQRYSHHPDCNTLVCFVYDPKARIQNPAGIEKDLGELSTKELKVIVVVRPRS